MLGYEIFMQTDGKFYLMHGQRTPGYNNWVPVKSLREAWQIAEYWHHNGISKPHTNK